MNHNYAKAREILVLVFAIAVLALLFATQKDPAQVAQGEDLSAARASSYGSHNEVGSLSDHDLPR